MTKPIYLKNQKGLKVIRESLWKIIEQESARLAGAHVSKLLAQASDEVWQAGVDALYDRLTQSVPSDELSGAFDLMWMTAFLVKLSQADPCCCGGGCEVCQR